MATTCRRGEIWLIDYGTGAGSEQSGFRPALVIQNDVGNTYSPTTIIAAISSSENRNNSMPTHVALDRLESTLTYDSVCMLEQIRTVDKTRLKKKIAIVSPQTMRQIGEKIKVSLGILTT